MIQIERRDELKAFLAENGIGTAIHYPMILPDTKPFAFGGNFENARNLASKGLSLPLNPWLREREVREVIEKVREFYSF